MTQYNHKKVNTIVALITSFTSFRLVALTQWVVENHYRNSHWVGSASVGLSPKDGVVDHRLRVFGVDNLRVADASVIPLIPNGNVHSTVLVVASFAAEMIKEDREKNSY